TKLAEDRALAELAEKKKHALQELDGIAALQATLRQAETKSATIGSNLEQIQSELVEAETDAVAARKATAAISLSAAELTDRIASIREGADEVERRLSGSMRNTRQSNEAVDAAAARAAEVGAALQAVASRKREVQQASAELQSIAAILQGKVLEAQAAIAGIDTLVKDGGRESAALASQLAAVGDVSQSLARSNGERPNDAAPLYPDDELPPVFTQATLMVQSLASEQVISADEAGRLGRMLQAGQASDALRLCSERLRGPLASAYHLIAGDLLRASGDTARAAEAYQKAAQTKSVPFVVRYYIALRFQELGRLDEAARIAAPLAKDPAATVLALNATGLHLRLLGNKQEAAKKFSEALDTPGFADWQYYETLYNMGELHESNGDPHSLALALWCYNELRANAPSHRDIDNRIKAVNNRLSKTDSLDSGNYG
ncbi:MAG: hypothetical protein M3007_07210, partial [Candidatus Eremiobacteraeota bacterium]|nr:hypothetical protein [Candidatus Eremiobacteraeota bacterium]